MSARAVLDWLHGPGRALHDLTDFTTAYAGILAAAGVPLARINIGLPLPLHPEIYSTSVAHEVGGETTLNRWRALPEITARVTHSPMRHVYDLGEIFRWRATDPRRDGEYAIITEMRAKGVTDYYAMPLRFSDGSLKGVTLATAAPGGFSAAQVTLFETTAPALSMVLEALVLRYTARTLLDTYVGRNSGDRILAGAIKRGDGETLRAVIWYSDLRGFSRLSNTATPAQVLDTLNGYFSVHCAAVERHGGEVLKFIGDAVLAIFPVGAGDDPAAVLTGAQAGAREALAEHAAQAGPPFGLALHVGDVSYGNVGGASRLDFTVIGPAVNLASRIEGLSAALDRPILLSAAARALVPEEDMTPLGGFELKGFDAPQEVYAARVGREEDRA